MKRIFAVFALFLLANLTAAHAQTPMELQTQADRAYDEKSYARALELYRQAKAAGAVREPEKVDFRIVQSLFKTEKWDEAIDSANFALKTANWKARFYYVLGQIYVKAPHQGYKLGDKIWRQDEFPEVAGDQKPVRVGFYVEDQKAALENLETAKVEAQKERHLAETARFFAPIYLLAFDEEIDLNFDLAAYLPQTQFDEFLTTLKGRTADNFDEVIIAKAPYSRAWSMPKKVLSLYAEIRVLDQSADKADAARSLLAEGLFVRAYKQRMEGWANQYDVELKKNVVRPYPFDEAGPIPSWNGLVDQFPRSPLAPQALLLVAQEWQSKDSLVKAAGIFRQLIQKYPQSKLVSDARAAVAQIERKEISFNLTEPARPGTQPKLSLNSLNVKDVQFAAYRVKLEDFLTLRANLSNPETTFTEFSDNFGSIADATRKFGAPVAKWTMKTDDKSDYQGVEKQTQVPVTSVGAYAVVASGNGARFGQIVLISDLALLKKTDKDGSFVYVADAKSGAPVVDANVVLKEVWDSSGRKIDVLQGKSDDAGFFDKKRVAPIVPNYSQVAAFAWVGNRYAITSQQSYYYGYYGNRNDNRVFGTTDRPVYRPGQTVKFRQVVTNRVNGGDWQPVKARSFTLAAFNPKGERFWTKNLSTNEFGSVSDEFVIPASAPLGEFSLNLTDSQSISGGTQFRVEEYKRPEFEVTVTAPTEAKRPGETVAARINAKYYFGSPVANAKVKYTVRKSTWWANYRFPSPYDWLYSSWGVGQYETGRRNIGGEGSGKIIKEGEVTTDAQGFAELSFKTDEIEAMGANDWWSRYSNPLYTIEAEVTDASRRVIEAQGQVKVARQPYFAFLDTQRGYFQKGDRVPIEIRTQDANEQSVAASGKMTVFKLLPGNREEKVFEEATSTDATGRAFWNWTATDSGQFRVEWSSRGVWGEEIKAQTEI
ncbi:MAG TPA: MG2 domain-containing protein, partial [Abditibacterium sp.]